jgi:hypothetical protein
VNEVGGVGVLDGGLVMKAGGVDELDGDSRKVESLANLKAFDNQVQSTLTKRAFPMRSLVANQSHCIQKSVTKC